MSSTLFETIRRIVREEVARVRTAELAVVEEQHPHADDSDTDNY
ncbi:MAG: Rhs element Vgr protein, partial [bacterium]|nr:Rhs element Vgr protein [bacterium]